jgi:ElaB/YqjD/DUF883 family membrane-anchored ribosome-binding protein
VTLDRDDDIRRAEADAADNDLATRSEADEPDADEIEVAEIRADIEETRYEMGGTLNELGERLDPGNLVNQAKENVREATIGRVEETAKGMSDMVMDTIKRNPIPAAMAGAGLAMLWMNKSEGTGNGSRMQHGSRYSPYYGSTSSIGQRSGAGWTDGGQQQTGIGDKAGQAVGAVGDNVGQAVGHVGQTASEVTGEVIGRGQEVAEEVGWRLERFMRASPLAVGAIAAGAGALIGALIPETQQEREMLGDASRQVGETVRDAVDEVGQQAEQKLDETERTMASSGSTGSGGSTS